MSNYTNSEPSLELIAARLAYAGATITTLGDILSTISAGIALKLVEQENRQASNTYSKEDFKHMQKEMDHLIRELQRIKKMLTPA
ncbi:hypothetical protein ACTHOQ_00775 [Solibacillus silvestris]|uniref:hypothetical protein n=1 Tax=Solibacillus silvestris TaxID=76853 RepID=UPI003F7DF708